MTDIQNMKMGPDVVGLTNAVCKGQSFIFAENFMQRMPILLNTMINMYWRKGNKPDVSEGGQETFLIVFENLDSVIEQKLFVREATYFNGYEMNIEDASEYAAQGYGIKPRSDEWDDVTYFYTGWAFDTSSECESFYTFIKDEDVKAWRDHPAVPNLNELEG
ncbi:hypothetical protein [Acinetobacter sp. ANC 3813]|uniref:hypothetical protein n=1 Tax=Acinetobacter sp. ANC 3813 TaxID=1977873 RepID=UPI000A32C8C8|nr:hypothetical protein [Acinetobacter sp. ANC 3813]OTG87838.1 hypothetical protein B9T34_16005 [Acinetobacter sp. ANC 3813]